MRIERLHYIKEAITQTLSAYLHAEGIALYVAANDNMAFQNIAVYLEAIEETQLFCDKLVTEIKVLLNIMGRPNQCDSLMEALYNCLHPYHLTLPEINVLLMNMYVQSNTSLTRRRIYKKTVMRYIMEEERA